MGSARVVSVVVHPVQWLVGVLAVSSAWTGALLVLDPARALAPFTVPWAREGAAAGDRAALVAALYGAAVLGEGALQLAAVLKPKAFLKPLVLFMALTRSCPWRPATGWPPLRQHALSVRTWASWLRAGSLR